MVIDVLDVEVEVQVVRKEKAADRLSNHLLPQSRLTYRHLLNEFHGIEVVVQRSQLFLRGVDNLPIRVFSLVIEELPKSVE